MSKYTLIKTTSNGATVTEGFDTWKEAEQACMKSVSFKNEVYQGSDLVFTDETSLEVEMLINQGR